MASKAPTTHEVADGLIDDEPETDSGPQRSGRAKAQPERRCIVTGVRGDPASMVRFVLSPDAVVTPDVAQRLPGRGAWLTARRDSIEKAVRTGAFSRAFKCQAIAPADLGDQTAGLVRARVLHHLGLGRRAGDVLCGFEIVREALKTEGCAVLVEASDGASDGREKLVQILRARSGHSVSRSDDKVTDSACHLPVLAGCFSAEELGMALGRERVVHACVRSGRFADVWGAELARFSGFAPIWPAEWPGLTSGAAAEQGVRAADADDAAPNGISPEGEE